MKGRVNKNINEKKCVDLISFPPIKYIIVFTKRPFTNYPKENDSENGRVEYESNNN